MNELLPGNIVVIPRGVALRDIHGNHECWNERDELAIVISRIQRYVEFDDFEISAFCIVFFVGRFYLVCDRLLLDIDTFCKSKTLTYRIME